jgi:two-component system copper resistance phosphate regulon response regulator CusR
MKVLLVEDFQLLRDSLSQGLREAGFAVEATGDGEEGLWLATSGDYDVIILDLMLPGVDGLSILKKLRQRKSPAHVLVLTAKDTTADRVRGLDLGADDYMVKPFMFAELLARVRALVRRRYEAKSPVICVADLEIDTTQRIVRRGGERIELSNREYAMLELMANRPGQVVTRTDIWEHVYESDGAGDSNVVDVFIAHLRKKLERPGKPKLIQTRHGHGYVFGEAEA